MEDDKLRERFSKLLDGVRTPKNADNILKQASYNRISQFIKKNIPSSLFRYRRFDQENYNVNAL